MTEGVTQKQSEGVTQKQSEANCEKCVAPSHFGGDYVIFLYFLLLKRPNLQEFFQNVN